MNVEYHGGETKIVTFNRLHRFKQVHYLYILRYFEDNVYYNLGQIERPVFYSFSWKNFGPRYKPLKTKACAAFLTFGFWKKNA